MQCIASLLLVYGVQRITYAYNRQWACMEIYFKWGSVSYEGYFL